jgi:hypothetical protein
MACAVRASMAPCSMSMMIQSRPERAMICTVSTDGLVTIAPNAVPPWRQTNFKRFNLPPARKALDIFKKGYCFPSILGKAGFTNASQAIAGLDVISLSLIEARKGERKAQSCDNACLQHL